MQWRERRLHDIYMIGREPTANSAHQISALTEVREVCNAHTLLSKVHNVHLHNWVGLIAAGYVNGAVKFKHSSSSGQAPREEPLC